MTDVWTGLAGNPAIAADPGGGFTVAWSSETEIYLQRFDASGSALSIAVATGAFSTQGAALAPDGSSGVIVVWAREEEGEEFEVLARDFAPVPQTTIETGPAGPTKVASPSFALGSDEYDSTSNAPSTMPPTPDAPGPFNPGRSQTAPTPCWSKRRTPRARPTRPPQSATSPSTPPRRHLDRLRPRRPHPKDQRHLQLLLEGPERPLQLLL